MAFNNINYTTDTNSNTMSKADNIAYKFTIHLAIVTKYLTEKLQQYNANTYPGITISKSPSSNHTYTKSTFTNINHHSAPLCKADTHTTYHLFNCKHIHMIALSTP